MLKYERNLKKKMKTEWGFEHHLSIPSEPLERESKLKLCCKAQVMAKCTKMWILHGMVAL